MPTSSPAIPHTMASVRSHSVEALTDEKLERVRYILGPRGRNLFNPNLISMIIKPGFP